MKVMVTGCCGYLGASLVPWLLADRHYVVGYDIQLFGRGNLPQDNGHLKLIQGDIRKSNQYAAALLGCEAVIHLAGLTSDKACQLDPKTAHETNVSSFENVVILSKEMKVKKFIFLSSAAVFGGETSYAKAKQECEKILEPYQSSNFNCTILRPGSICGYSPRMRFDLPVNQMTRDAFMKGEITVNGGRQLRTNVHIRDVIDSLRMLLRAPRGTYNLNSENISILDTAKRVASITNAAIRIGDYTDGRSYSMESDLRTTYTINEAIRAIVARFKEGYWKDALTNPVYVQNV